MLDSCAAMVGRRIRCLPLKPFRSRGLPCRLPFLVAVGWRCPSWRAAPAAITPADRTWSIALAIVTGPLLWWSLRHAVGGRTSGLGSVSGVPLDVGLLVAIIEGSLTSDVAAAAEEEKEEVEEEKEDWAAAAPVPASPSPLLRLQFPGEACETRGPAWTATWSVGRTENEKEPPWKSVSETENSD